MKMAQFFQDGPELRNQYDSDLVLKGYLRRVVPAAILAEIEPDLKRMGERTGKEILSLAREAEAQPPKHISHDAWGRRLDEVEVSRAWKDLDRISAEEGLVAIAYERKHGQWSRIYQFAKLYLFHPSSAFYTCPLAMTDGAARVLELYGDAELKKSVFPRLTSRHPDTFWTSGQWMTERTGGSDVGETSTVARFKDNQWKLYGDKWFTSATTSQMAMTLARPEDAEPGSGGLSLFMVTMKDRTGELNHVRVKRLKEKMGTKALPTAELYMEGTPAVLIGGIGKGVKKIASLFNITRVHNSIYAASFMRRGLALACDYSFKREVFGKPLSKTPLHLETLAELQVEFRAAFALAFRIAELLGRVETEKAQPGEVALLRILTPLAKLYTGKQAVHVMGEIAECFGGAGYVEDSGIPVLVRDSHVLPIWEGTTNVLSLDVLRAMVKDAALGPFLMDVRSKLALVQEESLAKCVKKVRESCAKIEDPELHREGRFSDASARSLAYTLARTYCAALLLEQAQWDLTHEGGKLSEAAAIRWCSQELFTLRRESPEYLVESRGLALSKDSVGDV